MRNNATKRRRFAAEGSTTPRRLVAPNGATVLLVMSRVPGEAQTEMTMYSFAELSSFLKATQVRRVFLSHEPEREKETRQFATELEKQGFEPLVAADFRKRGEDAVRNAIHISQFTLVLAFDEKTVKTCLNNAVAVIDMRRWQK